METKGLIDAAGHSVTLGKELGRGGEGAVFEIQGRGELVAKIYLKPPEREMSEKLIAMTRLATERITKLAAWPTGIVKGQAGSVVGFTMPKISDARPVYELYGPKLRLQQFPRADWRFLVHAARNLASAFAAVHEAGHVIGDVNHGNVVVSKDAILRFIDTDSFQITLNGRSWCCEVGVATHQPPEMQGKSSYKGIIRTPNHDNFGLAVLIFQLLCMARHPFSGKYLGSGEMPIERAIKEFRFAYSANSRALQMLPPPGSVPITALTKAISQNFERAFSREGMIDGRPKPTEWVSALTELLSNLKVCNGNASHYYLSSLRDCPWCEIEKVGGFALFPFVFTGQTQYADISSLWQQALSIPDPGPLPPAPSLIGHSVKPNEPAKRIGRRRTIRKIAAVGVVLLATVLAGSVVFQDVQAPIAIVGGLLGLFLFFANLEGESPNIVAEYNAVKQRWDSLQSKWTVPPGPTVAGIRQSLEGVKRQYDNLPNEYSSRLKQLYDNRKTEQLNQFLDRFRIAGASVEGIGQGRVAVLQSYNIETAADVNLFDVLNVPGFGQKLAERLLQWRAKLESRFVFDPKQGVSATSKSGLDTEIALKRQKLHTELSNGVAQMLAVSRQTKARYELLQSEAAQLIPSYAQASANMRAIGRL